jgi:hypothetical protein
MSSVTDTSTINLLPTRLFWIRLNRLLAWAMLGMPVVQLATRTQLATGMSIDLGLLLAHGAMSLVLFGAPRLKGKGFMFTMHVMGGRPTGLSARNRFLLGGYRIALGMTPLLVMLPQVPLYAVLPFFYPIARLPVTVLQHILDAAQYAMRRWGRNEMLAGVVVALYVWCSAANVIHALVLELQ